MFLIILIGFDLQFLIGNRDNIVQLFDFD